MIPSYRSYAVRRIKSSFKQNKHMTDTQEVANKLAEAQKTLEIIKRQVSLSVYHLFVNKRKLFVLGNYRTIIHGRKVGH